MWSITTFSVAFSTPFYFCTERRGCAWGGSLLSKEYFREGIVRGVTFAHGCDGDGVF